MGEEAVSLSEAVASLGEAVVSLSEAAVVSLSEALALTGISQRTLERFQEAGYLRNVRTVNGEEGFSRAELSSLFQIAPLLPPTTRSQASGSIGPSAPPSQLVPRLDERVELIDIVESDPSPTRESYDSNRNDDPLPGNTEAPAPEAGEHSLHAVVELQERLLTMRENDIEDLKKQRQWLQARVEKLEEQSDRDCVLLLSEARTIRQLVQITHTQIQRQKRSPVRAALEFFGLVPTEAPTAGLPRPFEQDERRQSAVINIDQ